MAPSYDTYYLSREGSMNVFPVPRSGQDRVCALSEKAPEVLGTHETPQEIGDVGHPAVLLGKRT